MKHLFLTFLFAITSVACLQAQSATTPAYTITGQVRGLADTTCVLAHYYGSGQYIPKDTARTDREGRMSF